MGAGARTCSPWSAETQKKIQDRKQVLEKSRDTIARFRRLRQAFEESTRSKADLCLVGPETLSAMIAMRGLPELLNITVEDTKVIVTDRIKDDRLIFINTTL